MATQTSPQVRVKSYFSASLPDALEVAHREMGPDALLLDCRPAPPEVRHLGKLEVVFGEDIDPSADAKLKAPPVPESPTSKPPQTATSSMPGLEQLSRKLDEISNLMLKYGVNIPPGTRRGPVEQVLTESGVPAALASEIDEIVFARSTSKAVRDISRPNLTPENDVDALMREAISELSGRVSVAPAIGAITALVGPPGVGKTTTLVKLAITEGLMKKREVRIISADWQRIAASEQLRIYAAILGVSFQSADSVSALERAIEVSSSNALILIDTPGLSPASMDGAVTGLARSLRQRQDIDIQLVLTATMRAADAARTAERFAPFSPDALIFTHLDETESVSSVFSEAARSGTPLSFFCTGQDVPEDIRPADARWLAESLVQNLPQAIPSAA